MSRSTHTAPIPSSSSGLNARTPRSYDAYRVPREVAPGFMDDGTISANHPLIHEFVAHTAQKLRAAETLAAVTGGPDVAARHAGCRHPEVTLWRFEEGGVACVGDVEEALGPMPARLAEAIFALAALSVYAFPTRPAHWAFWAEDSQKRVSELIHRVVCEYSIRAANIRASRLTSIGFQVATRRSSTSRTGSLGTARIALSRTCGSGTGAGRRRRMRGSRHRRSAGVNARSRSLQAAASPLRA